MKIIYVLHQFLPYAFAGTETYTYELARQISRHANNEVYIVAMAHKLENKFPAHTYKEEKFSFIKIKNKKSHLKEFKDILQDYQPDIVHFQHLQYFSGRVIEITKSLNIPMLLHLHDYFYLCKRIRLLTKDGNPCRSSKNCPGCKERRASWRRHIDSIDLMLANSHFTRGAYIKHGFSPEKIIVNYPGIDTKKLNRITHSKSDILRFGFLGTVIKEKGIEVLIEAFNRLGNLASLEIWGRVGSYRNKLLGKIKNSNIELKGEYNRTNLKSVLSNLDIIVIPSIWPEPWCIVKTEARASGLGILASKIGGISEGIGDSGVFFFRPNCVNSLLKAIKSAIANKDFWKKNHRVQVKTIEEDALTIQHIYTKLLSRYAVSPHQNLLSGVKSSNLNSHKYIVNSQSISWHYSVEGIELYKFNGRWSLAYRLKNVAKRFWELFTEFKPFQETVRTISLEYKVSYSRAKQDINLFMQQLLREKIIINERKLS